MIPRLILTIFICCNFYSAFAHQPDHSSTLLVEQSENTWIIQVRSALTAFEYAIENRYGESSYNSPEEFQNLVIDYFQNELLITANGENAILKNGFVQLGHESHVTFEVMGLPQDIQSLIVKNTGFKDISRNQSALIVVKRGYPKEQFLLDNQNNHTVNLNVKDASFQIVEPIGTIKNSYKWFIGAMILFLASFLLWKKRKARH